MYVVYLLQVVNNMDCPPYSSSVFILAKPTGKAITTHSPSAKYKHKEAAHIGSLFVQCRVKYSLLV